MCFLLKLNLVVAMATIVGCASTSEVRVVAESTVASASSPRPGDGKPRAQLFLIADNQERELFGEESFYSQYLPHRVSKVAIRSVEQDLFAKFVTQEAFGVIAKRDGPAAKSPVLHLGDLLDYGCQSELHKLSVMPWLAYEHLYIAPGNHDTIFQGNASYGGGFGFLYLLGKKLFNPSIDPTLDGHHNAVCARRTTQWWLPVWEQATQENAPAEIVELAKRPRYAGLTSRRKYPNVREWPQNFRCDYMRMKKKSVVEDASVETYCDDVRYFGFFKVDFEKVKEVGLPSTQLLPRQEDKYGLHISASSGRSLYSWNVGHLAQRIEVPLVAEGGAGAKGSIGVVLLDTTDWIGKPSWAPWRKGSDSDRGFVRDEQKDAVIAWLKAWSSTTSKVKGVVIAGHYPLSALEDDTIEWMVSLQKRFPFVLPVYLSAHTHVGYEAELAMKDGSARIAEINVGSIIDAPVHIRDLSIEWHEEASEIHIRSTAIELDKELGCKLPQNKERLAAYQRGFDHAGRLLQGSRFELTPKRQWCTRVLAAATVLKEFAPDLQMLEYDECVGANFDNEVPVRSKIRGLLDAEKSMIRNALANVELRNILACSAIGGADAFDGTSAKPKDIGIRLRRDGGMWRRIWSGTETQ